MASKTMTLSSKKMTSLIQIQSFLMNYPRIFIKFFAEWCQPCQKIKSYYEHLPQKYPHIAFKEVDIDEVPQAKDVYRFKTIPHFKYYEKGELKAELSNKELETFTGKYLA